MTGKMAKKLPKRTGKAQKVIQMENSFRRSAVRKPQREAENRERYRANEKALTYALADGLMESYPATKTARRKALNELKGQ